MLAWSWTEFGPDQQFTSHLRYEWQDEKNTRYARSPTRSPRATSSRRRCRPSWTAAALK